MGKFHRHRVSWKETLEYHVHSKNFGQTYKMELETFNQLVDILRPMITVDEIKARNSAPNVDPIYPELVCAIGLRWLAGGRFADIRDWAGISDPSYWRCRDLFLDAVIAADVLAIKWPTTMNELKEVALGFEMKSTNGVFTKCVGALDGMIAPSEQPKGVDNPRAYFSGHYQMMGYNIQAVCDAHLRFIYIATAGPGGMPDVNAIQEISLQDLIANLPAGFHVMGDAAYLQSEQLLIPYSGSQRADRANDIFNYYLSQLRIRIEMAFGLLTTKFRVFRSPLSVGINKVGQVVEVCARLHNFIITQQSEVLDPIVDPLHIPNPPPDYNPALGYAPAEPEDPAVLQRLQSVSGVSQLRTHYRNYIRDQGFERPEHNLERRANEETSG